MATYEMIITANEYLNASKQEFKELRDALMDDSDEERIYHGFDVSFEKGKIFIFSSDGLADELPDKVLELIGAIIRKNEKPYLEFGYAGICSRMFAFSHSGGEFRIYPDGHLIFPTKTYKKDESDKSLI